MLNTEKYTRREIIGFLKYHLREWEYQPKQVQKNFNNDARKYLTHLVVCYPVLNLRNVKP
jgi:hypothetical protein